MRKKEIQGGNFTTQASPNLRDEWDGTIVMPEARGDRAAQPWQNRLHIMPSFGLSVPDFPDAKINHSA